jgi:hypothetical protein
MKKIIRLLYALCLLATAPAICMAQVNTLMPLPKTAESRAGGFRLASDFTILTSAPTDSRVHNASRRLMHRISQRTGMVLDPTPPSGTDLPNRYMSITGGEYATLAPGMNESYKLIVSEKQVHLEASTDVGHCVAWKRSCNCWMWTQPGGISMAPMCRMHRDSPGAAFS